MFYDEIINDNQKIIKQMEMTKDRLDKIPLDADFKLLKSKPLSYNYSNDLNNDVNKSKEELAYLKNYVSSIQNRIPLLNDAVNVITLFDNANDYIALGEKYELKQLVNIKLPFDNMFIESTIVEMDIAIHIYYDNPTNKLKNIFSVDFYRKTKNHGIDSAMGYIYSQMAPRYYLLCQRAHECNHYIQPSCFDKLNNVLCQRTERTSQLCDSGKLTFATFPLLIYSINRMNNSSVIDDIYAGIPQIAHERNNLPGGRRFIYIKPHRKIYIGDRNGNESLGTHASPHEHERRGHPRKYRDENGVIIKEIWIEKTIINKGKEKSDTKPVYVIK